MRPHGSRCRPGDLKSSVCNSYAHTAPVKTPSIPNWESLRRNLQREESLHNLWQHLNIRRAIPNAYYSVEAHFDCNYASTVARVTLTILSLPPDATARMTRDN